MTSLTELHHITSNQHEEMGQSRIKRDYDDLQKLLALFDTCDPFDPSREQLQSLTSGIIAGADVNCDEAEDVGYKIQKKLDGVTVANAKISRADQAVTIGKPDQTVNVGNQKFQIDPAALFMRLSVLLERRDNIEDYFKLELTPFPTSLFKGNMMRKPNKTALATTLFGKCASGTSQESGRCGRWRWLSVCSNLAAISTYKQVVELYCDFAVSNYGKSAVVVFILFYY